MDTVIPKINSHVLISKLDLELARGINCSIINVVDAIIEKASEMRASDIHIDPSLTGVRIRFRVDGVLQQVCLLPKEIHGEVISRIKVLASLRTDEHNATQDGRIRHTMGETAFIDIRVSICPTYHGENAVLRLLSSNAEDFTLDDLGFSPEDKRKILQAIKKPTGMILATGPTGSGKTTTLYTLVRMLKSPDISIITIEDPIEYSVDGIEQIQVNARTGLTFANGLRSILRQDPNVIMVGEIRDAETAGIAVNTALTGHLLLSTVHTNDAATTIPRLLDMKIEGFLVATTVSIAIGQRLVRKICSDCKEETEFTDALREHLLLTTGRTIDPKTKLHRGAGCASCNGSGYSGRLCINEVLVADAEIREAILARASSADIKNIAIKNGMTTMFDDGLKKVEAGLTTLEEVLRVIHE
jgi:type II secretory ATPase GspE/PulE/Tfp pilus assembly ATPase PilB-like protein